jgi:hypothetical protein
MQEADSRGPKHFLVVPVFVAEVDDGADAVRFGKVHRTFDREAAADRELAGQPTQISFPFLPVSGLI